MSEQICIQQFVVASLWRSQRQALADFTLRKNFSTVVIQRGFWKTEVNIPSKKLDEAHVEKRGNIHEEMA